jgi:hypothetical protein
MSKKVTHEYWAPAVGSIYNTRDGRRAMIVAYDVRIDLSAGSLVEEVHAMIMDRLNQEQQAVAIGDRQNWPRIVCDGLGSWKGGDVIPDAFGRAGEPGHPLDLMALAASSKSLR